MKVSDYFYKIASDVRGEILKMHFNSQSSHIGSALSCVDILVGLYFSVLRINPKNPNDKNRDRFILSKGHAVSALYATLAQRGFFPKKILDQYCLDETKLPGHSTINCIPGVEVSTGSLGHGLSIGIGMAIAAKHDTCNYRVFVLLSDGECEEGAVWEASMFATHHKLDNLVAIVDYNKLQAFGYVKNILNLEPLKAKWEAFGWAVKEIDGHNFLQIISILKKVPFVKNKPSVIIAHTIKGKGISFMEDELKWHYKSPNKEEFEKALAELKIKK